MAGYDHNNPDGFPIHDDKALFKRLTLAHKQAPLSWETILKKSNLGSQSVQQVARPGFHNVSTNTEERGSANTYILLSKVIA